MGMYLNLGNDGFMSVKKGLYVDKTGLISYIIGYIRETYLCKPSAAIWKILCDKNALCLL